MNDNHTQPDDAQPRAESKRLKLAIGSALRCARTAKRWTQEDVAEKVGVTAEFYARVERGHTMLGLKNAVRLARLFGLEFDMLLGRKPLDTSHLKPDPVPRRLRKLTQRIRRTSPKHRRVIVRILDALQVHDTANQ